MRQPDGVRLADVVGGDLANAGEPAQAHVADQLVLEDLEHAHRALNAARGQAPTLQAPQGDNIGAECDGFDEVAAPLDAAVEHDPGATAHRLRDLGQRVQAAKAMVNLPTAVIGDPDVVDAMLDGDLGVFGRLHALEHERQAREALDAVQGVPGQRSLKTSLAARASALGWWLVATQHRPLAAA